MIDRRAHIDVVRESGHGGVRGSVWYVKPRLCPAEPVRGAITVHAQSYAIAPSGSPSFFAAIPTAPPPSGGTRRKQRLCPAEPVRGAITVHAQSHAIAPSGSPSFFAAIPTAPPPSGGTRRKQRLCPAEPVRGAITTHAQSHAILPSGSPSFFAAIPTAPPPSGGTRRKQRGFTLVEMVIVVAIVAMIVGIATTSIADMSRVALRKTSGIVASSMRAAYDEAALSGKTYRLAFVIGDPKTNAPSVIKVEASPELLVYDPETSTLTRALKGRSDAVAWDEFATGAVSADGSTAVDGLDEPSADLLDKVLGASGKDSARSNFSSHGKEEDAAQSSGFSEAAKNIEVDDAVRVLSVWTEGMEAPTDSGEAYIYFFPNGYAQDAIVHLQDDDRRVISVRLAPLTGRPTISEGYLEVPSADK